MMHRFRSIDVRALVWTLLILVLAASCGGDDPPIDCPAGYSAECFSANYCYCEGALCHSSSECPPGEMCLGFDPAACSRPDQYCPAFNADSPSNTYIPCEGYAPQSSGGPGGGGGGGPLGMPCDDLLAKSRPQFVGTCPTQAPITDVNTSDFIGGLGPDNDDACAAADGNLAQAINECWAASCNTDPSLRSSHIQTAQSYLDSAAELCGGVVFNQDTPCRVGMQYRICL